MFTLAKALGLAIPPAVLARADESTPAALAAYKATQTIPIVAFTAVDPFVLGFADSLGRPGRNGRAPPFGARPPATHRA